jgi:hypothetical protein
LLNTKRVSFALMKSFNQFWEEANLSDLARKHAQSAEGKREARKASRDRAVGEAKRRQQKAERLKREQRRKMLAKQHEAPVKSSRPHKDTEGIQRAEARGRAIRKGITRLGKATFKGIKKAIQKRRDNSQTGT